MKYISLIMLLSVSLLACNGSEAPQPMPVPVPVPTQSPSPSVTSQPSPKPSVTPSPSPTTDPNSLYTGPADVAKYVQKFVDDAKAQGLNVLPNMKNPKLTIRHGSLDHLGSGVIGLCETGSNLRRVTFDPDFWNNVSETQRELLAHHEFGHCVLYRPHTTAKLSTGAVASIMYPIIMGSSTYTNNYAYYQQELFQQTASTGPLEQTHVCDVNELMSE